MHLCCSATRNLQCQVNKWVKNYFKLIWNRTSSVIVNLFYSRAAGTEIHQKLYTCLINTVDPEILCNGDMQCSFPICDFPTTCQGWRDREHVLVSSAENLFHLWVADGQMEAVVLTFFSILAVNLTSGRCHMKDGMTFFFGWGVLIVRVYISVWSAALWSSTQGFFKPNANISSLTSAN